MAYKLYQLLSWLFFVISFPPFFLYSLCSGRHRQGLGQRFGFGVPQPANREGGPLIWLHGASVGEVQVACALIEELDRLIPRASFVLTTMTEQGLALAGRRQRKSVQCLLAPVDLSWVVERFLARLKPAVYICIETELWPTMLFRAARRGVRLVLLNGRMSERAFGRYRLARPLMRRLLGLFSAIAVITEADARRYRSLGAPAARVAVLGNTKYDFSARRHPAETGAGYRRRLGLEADQPLLLAGSTHGNEEELLIDVFRQLKNKDTNLFGTLVLAVAPRHLERLPEIETLFTGRGVEFERLSALDQDGRPHGRPHGRPADVVLVDTIGELAHLYAAADYVFCGGSLVERGGHNIMEAAAWGKPVLFGPDMQDFADAAEMLVNGGGGFRVANPGELTEKIHYLAAHPRAYAEAAERARRTARSQQGSSLAQARLVAEMLKEGYRL